MQKPEWLKIKPPTTDKFKLIKSKLAKLNLHTVCQESHCPNQAECWSSGTATIILMGDVCTRACRFCSTKTGKPKELDQKEPKNVVEIVKLLNLDYVVLTSVTRDDLKDGGAEHFAKCIKAIKGNSPKILVEVLIPDYSSEQLKILLDANPDVVAHNIETVERLSSGIRDARAGFQKSLDVLKNVKKIDSNILTKSALMVGMGESNREVVRAMERLRQNHVELLTIGQYLAPSEKHAPVIEYVSPKIFKYYEKQGYTLGFKHIASGPFVRSSYKAGETAVKVLKRGINDNR